MKILNKLFFFTAILFPVISVFGQAQVNPFTIQTSDLFDELKSYKAANPKAKTDDVVKTANLLLEKKGINYIFTFDSATCQKIIQSAETRKDKTSPLNLRTALKSVDGEKADLTLPEVMFGKASCLSCYVFLPVLKMTDKDFVTIIQGRNINFVLPSNFLINEAALVDNKDLTTVKTRWKIPFRTTPLSVSYDGNVLYLGFKEPEFKDLALAVFSEGVFQFSPKSEINAANKGTLLKEFPKDANNPNLSFIKFSDGERTQTVRFSHDCEN